MKRIAIITAMALSALAAPALAAPQWAEVDGRPHIERVERVAPHVRFAQAREISASDAKRIALSRVRGGEVVDIRRTGNAFRVRVIARDGRVVDIVVDARTGRVR